MQETYSRFGGLWIDRKDSENILAERRQRGLYSADLADKIANFMRDGFVILKRAVAKEETAALRSELETFWENAPNDARVETYEVPGSTDVQVVKPKPEYRFGTTKLLDYHAFSDRMRRAVANPLAVEFLTAIFETKPKAFQGLTFWRGSQQSYPQRHRLRTR